MFYSENSISSKYEIWKNELVADVDSKFLLEGLKYGFRITDVNETDEIDVVNCANHPSVKTYQALVESELKDQIQSGNYIVTKETPVVVSPLGAILKEGKNEVRLIHDCSYPKGCAVNDYALASSVQYENMENAYQLAKEGSYMCKIDLKSAYRSVAINPADYRFTGLQFQFDNEDVVTKFFDVRLPFGSRKGPMIFHRLSQSVKRMMSRRGYDNLCVYLDDFLIVEDSYEKCVETQQVLLSLLIRLGFRISWAKVTACKQKVEFLGICIDTVSCTASLSSEKVKKLYDKLYDFKCRKRASRRQLQSLAGSLNWACQVVRGGRFFLRRILDVMSSLKQATHKCKINKAFYEDVEWWLNYLHKFNGSLYYKYDSNIVIHTDACIEGGGMFCNGMWKYVNWKLDVPGTEELHINYKEVLTAILSIEHFAPLFPNSNVTIVTDSTAAKGILNKGRCRNSFVMDCLRKMFCSLQKFNE